MSELPRLVTADEFDAMTPNERAAVVREGIVTDWDELPEGVRQRIIERGQRLGEKLGQHAG